MVASTIVRSEEKRKYPRVKVFRLIGGPSNTSPTEYTKRGKRMFQTLFWLLWHIQDTGDNYFCSDQYGYCEVCNFHPKETPQPQFLSKAEERRYNYLQEQRGK